MRRAWTFGSLCLALLSFGCDDSGPTLVSDGAGLMSEDRSRFVETYHAYLREDHDIDYRLVTVQGVDDINRFAVEEFERLRIGALSTTGRGLLLVIDSVRDRVRLEVGHALEGVYPDAFVAYIEHRQMIPFFAERRVADGVLAATELIVDRAQRAAAHAAFDEEIWMDGSGGAGATARARLGRGPSAIEPRYRGRYEPGETPEATLRAYLAAMSARNADPSLELYTPETRRMLEKWTVTPAQMDNVLKVYRRCVGQSVKHSSDGRRAVIRYPVDARECAPWFFERAGGRWRLDLDSMQRTIRFGRGNAWHFDPGRSHPYDFAFSDWSLDARGFPRR